MTPVPFTLTHDDLVAGNALAIRRSLRKAAPRYAMALALAALGVTLIAFAIKPQPIADTAILFVKIFAIYWALTILIFLLAIFVAPKLRANKNGKQMPALTRDQSVSWDETAMSFASHYGSTRVPLTDFYQWAANDGIVIIYPADHLFYMLPKRIFSDHHDWDNLVSVLQNSKVPRI
jgi:hypothetical protein